jgi:hypothetical protein
MANVDQDVQINFEGLLKLGYGVIDVRYRDYDVSNDNLKFVITRIDGDRDDFYPEMLKYYLSKEIKDKNVYELWIRILKHKITMSNSLRRDVSIKVAAIDFVEHGNLFNN